MQWNQHSKINSFLWGYVLWQQHVLLFGNTSFFKKALEFDMTMAFTTIVGLIISDDETTVT